MRPLTLIVFFNFKQNLSKVFFISWYFSTSRISGTWIFYYVYYTQKTIRQCKISIWIVLIVKWRYFQFSTKFEKCLVYLHLKKCLLLCFPKYQLCKILKKCMRNYLIQWQIGHKKRKDSMETRTAFSWILKLTSTFGGSPSDSASSFFKIASASCFEAVRTLIDCYIC